MTLNGPGVAVIVGVDVGVGVDVSVAVGEAVGVAVGVDVGVGVAVSVAVGLKVGLGVGAGVVGTGDGEGARGVGSLRCGDPQAANSALNPANWRKVRRVKGRGPTHSLPGTPASYAGRRATAMIRSLSPVNGSRSYEPYIASI